MSETPFNPFTNLVDQGQKTDSSSNNSNFMEIKINSLIEHVFGITVNQTNASHKPLVFLEDASASASSNKMWTFELLENSFFDRLFMSQDQLRAAVVPSDFQNYDELEDSNILDNRIIIYLYKSFVRNENSKKEKDIIIKENCDKIRNLILQNLSTALKQPDIFSDQPLSFSDQFLYLFKNANFEDSDSELRHFLSKGVTCAVVEDDGEESLEPLKKTFYSVFDEIFKTVKKASLTNIEKWILQTLQCFVSDKENGYLANLLLSYSTPPENCLGIKYLDTLFGQLLSLSIMPKTNNGPYEFYENVQQTTLSAIQNLTSTLWNYLSFHLDAMTQLFKGFLLVGGPVKNDILSWIGNALHANTKRGQIWNSHEAMILGNNTVPDSFMIGLASVLLRLCNPLVKPQFKVLLVDPTISGVETEERDAKNVHIRELNKETCLLPSEEKRLSASTFNFITECFFLTHKAIDLGHRVCLEKLQKLNREVQRLHNLYQDSATQGNPEVIKQHLVSTTQHYMSLQNLLLEPKNNEMLLKFYEATSIWIMQLIRFEGLEETQNGKGYAPLEQKALTFPIKKHDYIYLKYVPEFLLENVVGFLHFEKNYMNNSHNSFMFNNDVEAKNNIFTMILAFMGSPERVRNPHLRARLAEGLESFLPKDTQSGFQMNMQMFEQHEHRLQIVDNLLSVFVSIEMTGQSVEFEQKFNYRRPMYNIMNYLWKLPDQRKCFEKSAQDALNEMEDMEVPIFLRFVNLLINDAIFLLDESLTNIKQIHDIEAARDNNEWANLQPREVQQHTANLRHMGMFARFYNILGRDTINMLKLLTSQIKGIFCHSSMVDRIAAMLNYFLLNLVGPKKDNFKVKDKKEYEFDPAHTVKEICHIYLNLKESQEFCLAVLSDGRSYSSQLFQFAENVLVRIGGGNLITDIQEFATKLNEIEKSHKANELALNNPPDEFLDPIMSTLMRDPVILPSSKITVDRPTISRHLLSDQTDPFNRERLTIEQLIPDVELKKKIDEWIKEKLENYQNNIDSQ